MLFHWDWGILLLLLFNYSQYFLINADNPEQNFFSQYQDVCRTEYPDNIKCQLKCLMKKSQLIDGDGDLHRDGLKTLFPFITKEREELIFKKCYPIKAFNCINADQLMTCIKQSYNTLERESTDVTPWPARDIPPRIALPWSAPKKVTTPAVIINSTKQPRFEAASTQFPTREIITTTKKSEIAVSNYNCEAIMSVLKTHFLMDKEKLNDVENLKNTLKWALNLLKSVPNDTKLSQLPLSGLDSVMNFLKNVTTAVENPQAEISDSTESNFSIKTAATAQPTTPLVPHTTKPVDDYTDNNQETNFQNEIPETFTKKAENSQSPVIATTIAQNAQQYLVIPTVPLDPTLPPIDLKLSKLDESLLKAKNLPEPVDEYTDNNQEFKLQALNENETDPEDNTQMLQSSSNSNDAQRNLFNQLFEPYLYSNQTAADLFNGMD